MSNKQFKFSIDSSALIIIDMQKGHLQAPCFPYSMKEIIQNQIQLFHLFKKHNGFIVVINVSFSTDEADILKPLSDMERQNQHPKGWDVPLQEFTQYQDYHNYYSIRKHQWGAFFGTSLDLQLRRRNLTNLVVCGYSTGIGVDTTAREAYQFGYNQIFIEDAMGAMTRQEHEYTCKYIFPRIGLVRKTEQAISMLFSK